MARLCSYKGIRGEWMDGIFHRWGDAYEYGPGDEKIPLTVAIVEDVETGNAFSIDPGSLSFHPRPNPLSPDHDEKAQELLDRLIECER